MCDYENDHLCRDEIDDDLDWDDEDDLDDDPDDWDDDLPCPDEFDPMGQGFGY